jgi:hypothetical protein
MASAVSLPPVETRRLVRLPSVETRRLVSLPSVEAPQPLFAANDVVVVLSRCFEKSPTPLELLARNVPFVVYQKMEGKCNTTGSLAQLQRDHGKHALRVRWMDHNRGDECSAYLQFIVDHYSALPRAVAFLQYDSRHQLLNYHSSRRVQRVGGFVGSIGDALVAVQAHRMNMSRGFIALGRHSFEGEWPGPCEPITRANRFRECSAPITQHVLGRNASGFLRFYSNGKHCMLPACTRRVHCMHTACALHVHEHAHGVCMCAACTLQVHVQRTYMAGLFIVARARIRARPADWYRSLLGDLSGSGRAVCDGPDTRGIHPWRKRLLSVSHHHVLELLQHTHIVRPRKRTGHARACKCNMQHAACSMHVCMTCAWHVGGRLPRAREVVARGIWRGARAAAARRVQPVTYARHSAAVGLADRCAAEGCP